MKNGSILQIGSFDEIKEKDPEIFKALYSDAKGVNLDDVDVIMDMDINDFKQQTKELSIRNRTNTNTLKNQRKVTEN